MAQDTWDMDYSGLESRHYDDIAEQQVERKDTIGSMGVVSQIGNKSCFVLQASQIRNTSVKQWCIDVDGCK